MQYSRENDLYQQILFIKNLFTQWYRNFTVKLPVLAVILLAFMNTVSSARTNVNETAANEDVIAVSQQLLLHTKTQEPADSLVKLLKNISGKTLSDQLKDDVHKKTFWINIYNAFTQIILTKNPDKYKKRNLFFGDKQINVAGKLLSLDDIEHGILRHSKIKWSLGYLNKLFPGTFEKQQRVDALDYRIHFSLNCGAKSCPPIAFYKTEQLDEQLDMATKAYLQGEAEYNKTNNAVGLPALMSWYRGDFGGKRKMIKLLHKLQIVPKEKNPSIRFKSYNWNLFLENYKSE